MLKSLEQRASIRLRRHVRSALKFILYSPVDLFDSLSGQRDEMVPPRRMIGAGASKFRQVGDEFFGKFVDLAGLSRHDRVLDIGCGVGRMALPLMKYLDEDSSYEGFDIVKTAIDWCTKKISTKCPNFRFLLADVFNRYYNPDGEYKASEYRFPYKNEYFDFVFLCSVFTHLLPRDMENYLAEITRVLRRGGRCLITFLLENVPSRQIDLKMDVLDFKYAFDGYRFIDRKVLKLRSRTMNNSFEAPTISMG